MRTSFRMQTKQRKANLAQKIEDFLVLKLIVKLP